jgi:hypothetical protein
LARAGQGMLPFELAKLCFYLQIKVQAKIPALFHSVTKFKLYLTEDCLRGSAASQLDADNKPATAGKEGIIPCWCKSYAALRISF